MGKWLGNKKYFYFMLLGKENILFKIYIYIYDESFNFLSFVS